MVIYYIYHCILYTMLKKINNEVVKPIRVYKPKPDEIKGYSVIPKLYTNIFICGMTGSGKSNVIFKIITSCLGVARCGMKTNVVIVSSQLYNDENYQHIIDWMCKKGYNVETYTDSNGGLLWRELMERWRGCNGGNGCDDEKLSYISCDEPFDNDVVKRYKGPYAPENMLIIDDLSTELWNRDLAKLLKENRHMKNKTIISTQYFNDLIPEGRTQIDFLILMPLLSEKKLEEAWKNMSLPCEWEEFVRMYRVATMSDKEGEKSHNFLYCSRDRS